MLHLHKSASTGQPWPETWPFISANTILAILQIFSILTNPKTSIILGKKNREAVCAIRFPISCCFLRGSLALCPARLLVPHPFCGAQRTGSTRPYHRPVGRSDDLSNLSKNAFRLNVDLITVGYTSCGNLAFFGAPDGSTAASRLYNRST